MEKEFGFNPENRTEGENGKERLMEIRQNLTEILEVGEERRLAELTGESLGEYQRLVERDGERAVDESLSWHRDNNHRMNLYQLAGEKHEGWEGEPMPKKRGEHLLAVKKLDLCIKQSIGSDDPAAAVRRLESLSERPGLPNQNAETAVDTLARLGSAGTDALRRIAESEDRPMNLRTRAVMSGLRYGEHDPGLEDVGLSLLAEASRSDDQSELYQAIEMAGLVGGPEGMKALDSIEEKTRGLDAEKAAWLKRDLVSARLSIDPDSVQRIKDSLGGRLADFGGICFGSLSEMGGFEDFVKANGPKLREMAKALSRTNEAFGGEPVKFVDIVPDSKDSLANEGWTADAVYLSKTLIEHPKVSSTASIQGLIHEACERWESKGFVDAQMERDYLELMGDSYEGSLLDKFRLKHRMDMPTRSGHPWDGTREYMAEAGSVLLADTGAKDKLFDKETDEPALRALENVDRRIRAHREKVP